MPDEAFPDRCVEIGANLYKPLKTDLIACLKKNLHMFTWAVEDMPGIVINITCHELNVDPTFKPIKQKRRKLGPERASAVNDEFPTASHRSTGEATARNKLLSFMDAFSWYNQIMMNPDDQDKTVFIIDRRTYCYKVMTFGLKNAGATDQRLVNRIFSEQLRKTMEVYINDMLVKSLEEQTMSTISKNALIG
ncbi:hypothetical protein N665_0140s0008 [Sinapis alba]|nr:hypothetical protein N665_0140s0008 [Sinapis alba]